MLLINKFNNLLLINGKIKPINLTINFEISISFYYV